jgi:hypothetical protein
MSLDELIVRALLKDTHKTMFSTLEKSVVIHNTVHLTVGFQMHPGVEGLGPDAPPTLPLSTEVGVLCLHLP